MGSVLETVQLLKEETARVADYLKKLSPQAWATQSACDAWQVADVVAHVAGAIDRYGPNIARGAKGDYSVPADATPSESPADRDAVMLANAQKVIDYRVSLGDGVWDAFNDSRLKFDAIFAELGEDDREKLCFHNAGIISVETYLNLRITELIIHEWDCRSRLEPGAVVSAESIPSTIENFPVFAVGRVFDPGGILQNSARSGFDLPGAGAEGKAFVA
ncbi:MAG: maleylpyruvate isomerase N-terminal domain-containing protein, partial [Chloroflexi bacterium]|nr:maleylpyruvate isomerase N-terminal domain-containing protein [Chloroflexota bacterium]